MAGVVAGDAYAPEHRVEELEELDREASSDSEGILDGHGVAGGHGLPIRLEVPDYAVNIRPPDFNVDSELVGRDVVSASVIEAPGHDVVHVSPVARAQVLIRPSLNLF